MSAPTITPITLVTASAATMGTPGMTRAELMLRRDDFGGAVIDGMSGRHRGAVTAARAEQAELRGRIGYRAAPAPILTGGASQHKLAKNSAPSLGMMLAPERKLLRPDLADIRDAYGIAGGINVCPRASQGCAFACLDTSGQSGMPTAQRAQAARTAFLLARPRAAGLIIGAEIAAALRRTNDVVNLRLNTTSDLRWELISADMISALVDAGVMVYDYTAWRPTDRVPVAGYDLTYSAKETSHTPDDYLVEILRSGGRVAIPFDTRRHAPLPLSWRGFPVIDGDQHDERWRDPAGVVVGLRAKGHAWRRDNSSGFIRSASAERRA